MKRMLSFLFLFLFLVVPEMLLAEEAAKENIAIIGTKVVEDDWGTTTTGEGYLVDYFLKSKRFNVIERSALNSIMQEQKIQTSGMIDDNTAVKLGALAGAKYLLLYTVTSVPQPFSMSGAGGGGGGFGSMLGGMKMKIMMSTPAISVNVRIVNVQDSKISYNKNASRESAPARNQSEEGKLKQDGERIVNGFVKDIMNKEIGPDLQETFPVRGYIIDVHSPKEVEIDLGKDMGLHQGSELLVLAIGKERKHPVTGKIIPGTRTEVARLKVKTINGPESSICECTQGEALAVGQIVELAKGQAQEQPQSDEVEQKARPEEKEKKASGGLFGGLMRGMLTGE